MGIVRKQTILTSIFIYLGVFFGFFSNIFFKPQGLTTEEIGIISLVDSLSGLISIFFSLGLSQVILRKFQFFKTEDRTNNGFLSFILSLSLFGFTSFFLLSIFFPNIINQTHGFYNNAFFVPLIAVVVFFRILFRNLDVYVKMNFNATLSAFLESFLLKFLLFVAFFLVRYNFIDFNTTFLFTIVAFSVPGLIILIYALTTTPLKWPSKELKSTPKKEWATLSFFGLITGTSSILVLYTDQLMVNYFLGASALGVYTIMFFIGIFINIPSRGFKGIATAFISDYWSKNEIKKIDHFYKRSSNNQGIIAVFVFLCIWISIDDILSILPEPFAIGKYVIFFIGLAQVTDMLTGINSEIIATSPFYKWNAYFNISLVVLTFITNVIFIHFFGLVGAAIASLISLFVVNSARFLLLYLGYGLNPFSKKTLMLTLTMVILLTLIIFIPLEMNISSYFAIIIKCAVLSVIFWGITIKLKVSEDINELLFKYLNKLRIRK